MPYDIVIFRGDPDNPEPIGPAEVLAALRGVREPDRDVTAPSWRVWAESRPWFLATLDERGVLTLSASYSNPTFLELVERFGREAVRIGGVLRARATEEVSGDAITAENVAALYAPDGALLRHVERAVQNVQVGIGTQARAPLDFPVGPVDLVSEYFIFHLRGVKEPTRRAAADALEPLVGAHRIRVEGPSQLSLLAPHDPPNIFKRLLGAAPPVPALVKVLVRDEGTVQIWPWWTSPAAAFGPLAIDAARTLHDALGGSLTFDGARFDGAVEDNLRMRLDGALTDLWRWTQRLDRAS